MGERERMTERLDGEEPEMEEAAERVREGAEEPEPEGVIRDALAGAAMEAAGEVPAEVAGEKPAGTASEGPMEAAGGASTGTAGEAAMETTGEASAGTAGEAAMEVAGGASTEAPIEAEAVPAEESGGEGGEAAGLEAEWKRRALDYAARAVFSEARAAAGALGVPENRLDYAARLADAAGIDLENPDARERIARAVQAVLRDVPELRGCAGTGRAAVARRPRREAFERGFMGD